MNVNTVRSLLIPLSGGKLLVPNAVVAEIIAHREPDVPHSQPEWLRGMLHWRGKDVPLVSLETLLGISAKGGKEKPRIVIFYGLQNADNLPFYAINTIGMPTTLLIKEDTLESPKKVKRAGILASVEIEGKSAWLPDFDYLEKLLMDEAF